MSDELDVEEETEGAKPTITIAEKDGSEGSSLGEKPTITIAEKDGGS